MLRHQLTALSSLQARIVTGVALLCVVAAAGLLFVRLYNAPRLNELPAKATPTHVKSPSGYPAPTSIILVPAGQYINVRLDQAVGSRLSQPGQTFSATVAEPVEISGKVAIPQGAQASGTVAEAVPLGRIKGGARLRLVLDVVTFGGDTYHLETAAITASRKGKRSAVAVGGGAGLGGIIGALAGGAAIGAVAGTGAGTAGAAFTGNKNIELPAHSTLMFKVIQPVSVRPPLGSASGFTTLARKTNGGSKKKRASARSMKPVYNAVFSPTAEGTQAVLLDSKPSTVDFFIGPEGIRNAITTESRAVNPALTVEHGDVDLNVTMICLFCVEPKIQKKPITYSGQKRLSTHAVFEFTPQRSALNNETGSGRIAFQITRTGVQIDYVSVDVTVVQPVATNPKSTTVSVGRGKIFQARFPKEARPVDLLISLRPNGNVIEAHLEPGADLERLFGAKNLDENGKATRWLRTGLTVNEVRGAVGAFYLSLKSIIDNNQNLKTLLAGTRTPQATVADVLLSQSDKATLLQSFTNTGGLVYRKLFITGCEPELRDMMEMFDAHALSDRAVRVRIESQSIYFPWQVLVPPGNNDETAIWGFRYELSVSPTGTILPGPFPGPLRYKQGGLLYGHYRGATTDDVARLALMQLHFLESELHLRGILIADSRDAFLQNLGTARKNLQVLLTFTHGLSGTTIKDTGESVESVAGPQLEFADHEYVPAAVLNQMLAQLPKDEIFVLPNGPVVFLNGCETGTAGFYATTNLDFAGVFLAMGSRGVIVTEAPIWTYFGYNFGILLLRQLQASDPIPLALLKLRKEYLMHANNPLGLLYSYYGGPDVSLSF